MIEVKQITASDALPLRQRVLRPGKPVGECRFPGDDAASSFHLGGFAGDKLVCIASVIEQREERFGLFESRVQFQLRGMAADKDHRGQGISTAVLDACVRECWERGAGVFWCNARHAAAGFYQSRGFAKHAVEFDLPGIGMHRVMYLLHEPSGQPADAP